MRMKPLPWLLCCVPALLQAATEQAPGEPKKSLQALRTAMPITVDGHLDEAIWAQAPVATGFTVSQPDFGKTPANRTEVRVLYDDRFVYVGARLHHALGRKGIVQQLHRRDQDSASDWFGVSIDSLHDRRTAFTFMVNAAGVQQDRIAFADTNEDSSWDSVWESAVSVDEEGWTAELKIPLSVLRLKDTQDGQTWGINFLRADYLPRQEISQWQVVPRGVSAYVSHFPELRGIEGVKPQPRREWVPYLSAQRKFETAQPFDDRKWKVQGGLDTHFGINSYSQLDLTLRPDFGQVEVDQAVLNLSTLETFLPEKRPFFLEGMEIFQFTGPTLFYSRRMGKGLGGASLQAGETLVDQPLSSDILGAAKYTSKFASGLNLGLLAANMEVAKATIRDANGLQSKRELEPMTNAMVLRATQDIDDRGSFVGGFASYLHQAGALGRGAQVGGVDAVFKPADRSGSLGLSMAYSKAGLPTDSLAGSSIQARADKKWKNGWSINGWAEDTSKNFNPNDLGYNPRGDIQNAGMNLNRRWDEPWGPFRNRRWTLGYWKSRDQAGTVFEHFIGHFMRAEFNSSWALTGGFEKSLAIEDDRELRTFDDPVKKYLHVDAYPRLFAVLESPNHWPWSFVLNVFHHWREGGPTQQAGLTQSIRPLSNLEFQLETTLDHQEGQRHYLETQGTTPIVGMRRLNQLGQVLRVSYAFSPRLTVQLFSQWMDAAWAFRDLQSYVNDHQLASGASSAQTAFSDRLWNVHLITRWEFRPGSALYAVYTHGASTSDLTGSRGSIRPLPDLAQLRHLPSDDVLQVKLSWLFR